ncbi:polysaccharide biosynthesis tyrosine autokinase [Jannaschia sp. M317]|uniref:GumC family protein n=1 Tax=Jannaschia sp. M317 TaxID=2867011 RepID=UPI0021A88784|nr:polysaccharide biosynthesis tyrosine autokinase [Jannaschia sp. M317]UWQ19943.1 polysaccharide biosynthesis tyrosine autokinase [Jannaschia sp. M317]
MTHNATDPADRSGAFGGFRPGGEELLDGIDPREVLRGIWQGRYVIALTAVLFGVVAYLAVSQITPTYTSIAKVLLDPRERSFVSDDQVVSDLNLNSEVVASEISILQSNVLLEQVARRLQADRPDLLEAFYPSTAAPSLPKRVLAMVGIGDLPDTGTPQAELSPARLDGVVWALRRATDVWRDGDAYIISILAETENPVFSAMVAGTIAEVYIAEQLAGRQATANQATAQIEVRVEELRKQVEAAEQRVQDYRANTLEQNGTSIEILSQRLLDLNEELVKARIERGAAEARYNEMQRAITEGGFEALGNMVTSEAISELTTRRLELEASDAEWAERFRTDHPERRKIQNRLNEVDRALEAEIARALDAQRNELQIARVREQTMQETLTEVEGEFQDASRNSIGLRQLERESEAIRSVYQDLLTRVAQTRTQESFQVADARLIERATVPGAPAAPRPKLMTVLGLIVGAAVGFAIVLLRRLTSRTFRSMAELERFAGHPVVAVMAEQNWNSPRKALLEIETNRMGPVAESVRALRNHLNTGAQSMMTRSIVLMSPLSGDGKTTTTLLLARLAEMADEMVVVVDFDLRQNTLAKELILGERPGTSDYLCDECTLDEAIIRDDDMGFDIVTAGTCGPTAADDLRSANVRQMLDELKETYDVVLVNCPAMLQVPDATLIAKAVDQCLLLVRHDSTPQAAVKRCLSILGNHKVTIDGLIMTRADPDDVEEGYLYSYGYS